MVGQYRALLIGNSTYPADEHNLQTLKGPVKDIAALNRALVDPATGLFAARGDLDPGHPCPGQVLRHRRPRRRPAGVLQRARQA